MKHSIAVFVVCIPALLLPVLAWADSPLADAVEKQDRAAFESLLEAEADVNASQIDGMTALHWAAHHDDLAVARQLLKSDAQANVENRYGVTPLYSACQNGNGALVELLVEAEVDPNSTFNDGETALMIAARTGRPGAVRALLDNGADVNKVGPRQQTALMWASAEGNLEVVKVLVDAGANLHARLDSGFTPLLFAVRNGKQEVVHALLQAGVDLNEAAQPKTGRLPKGSTSLTLAIENGHFALAASLLESGADPGDMRTGFSPLHILSWVRKPNGGDGADDLPPPDGTGELSSLQMAKTLVEHGADVNAQLKRGKSHWPGATPFYLASWTADVPMMRTLVELGADPLIPAKDGSTALMAATGIGRKMEDLSAGTEPEILAAAKYLLELGIDIDATNRDDETAMHGAAYKNLPTVIAYLDKQKANVEIWHRRNRRGSTPYLIAAGYRPGNFKPSRETMAAISEALAGHGIEPTEEPPKRIDPYATKSNQHDAKQTPVKKLFNGWNLEGWSIQNGGRFSVEDGILKLDGGTGWLRSEKTYADFKLFIEFRFLEKKANSGIFVRTGPTSNEDKNGWPNNGYQVQCMDTLTGKPLATMLPYGAPPFEHESDLEALKKAYKPVGEWQTFEITAMGEKLEVRLNGAVVTTARSIKNRDGHIGIQGENGLLEFRKIELHP
ncbi:MAG: ankyrin repeat domain-containing protein [Rubripirellula sp.]